MASSPAPESELLRQKTEVEADFSGGWVPRDVGTRRVLTDTAYAAARKIIDEGGWSGLDRVIIEAVRDGAQPGDALPPREARPFIDRMSDIEVILVGSSPHRCVAVLFSYDHFPGIRFGHRLPLPSENGAKHALIWLKEQIETGALHRMMRNPPAPDSAGITWTTWTA
jgi:hypothetical protein